MSLAELNQIILLIDHCLMSVRNIGWNIVSVGKCLRLMGICQMSKSRCYISHSHVLPKCLLNVMYFYASVLIKFSIVLLKYVFIEPKTVLSRGCNQCEVCGGKVSRATSDFLARVTDSRDI